MRNVLGGGQTMNQYPSWEHGSAGMGAPMTQSEAGPSGFGGYGNYVPAAGDVPQGTPHAMPPTSSAQTMTLPASAVQAGGGGQPPLIPQTLPQGPGWVKRSLTWAQAKAMGMPWWVWLAIGAGGMYYWQRRRCACKKPKSVLQSAYEDEVDEDDGEEAVQNPKPKKGTTAARVVGTALGALARSSLGV